MELKDTIDLMLSDSHYDRLLAERNQLTIRVEKLRVFLNKYRNKELDFEPNCEYDLLHEQLVFMEQYLAVLNQRVLVER